MSTARKPETLYEAFSRAVALNPGRTALMHRGEDHAYRRISYREMSDSVNMAASAITRLGISKGDRVAIFSHNRPEWIIVDLAVLKIGAIVVPVYPTLSPAAVKHILTDSGTRLVFVEDAGLLSSIRDAETEIPCLETIAVFDTTGIDSDADVIGFDELINRRGEPLSEEPTEEPSTVLESDIATIVYTSGTTGVPKGALLSHGNVLSNALTSIKRFRITPNDVFLSFLPLCHMFEKTCGHYTMLFAGATVAYAKNLASIVDDVQAVRPTILIVVPRLVEKIFEAVEERLRKGSPIRGRLVTAAIRNLNRAANLRYTGARVPLLLKLKCALYDTMAASKFRKIAGGRVRLLACGSAALDRKLAKTLYVLGFNIVEGYGLTEASPVVATGLIEDIRLGTVGKPFDDVEVRIGDRREILVRGPNVMRGYYNRPEDTAEALDEDGWLHTGDQGRFDEDGNLIITGRIKEVIVTSYGKNVAPVPIEIEITKSRYIDQALVYGDKRKHIVALIVPDRVAVERYAREKNMTSADYGKILARAEIRDLIAVEIEKATVTCSSYEKVKVFTLLPEGFTITNQLLTPTMKLRRNNIAARYRNEIDSMYTEE
ncbi:MAG: long-chain fatty acid--CoA ligase [Candidatus Eisenbacteria bacterium]